MTTPMRLGLAITADASGVGPATTEARREIDAVKQSTTSLATTTGGLAAANDEAQRSAQRLTQTLRGQAVAEQQLRSNIRAMTGAANMNTANIAAQFQDIAVTSAMGMSPMQVALQQGTQLSAVFDQLKASGQSAGTALAAAFRSVISPLSLVTIGGVAAAAALIQYVGGLKADIPSVDDILSRHEDHISRLGPAYAKAAKGSREYATQSADAIDALLTGDLEGKIEKISGLTAAAIGDIQKAVSSEAFQMGPAAGLVPSRFEPFREVIDLFREGRIDAIAFAEGVRQIELANPKYAAQAAELRSFTAEVVDATLKLSGVSGEIDRVALAFARMQEEIDRLNPFNAAGRLAEVEKAATDLFTRARAGQIDVHDLAEALRNLSAVNPDLSAAIGEIAALGEAALNTQRLVDGLANTTPKTRRLGAMDQADAQFDETLAFQRRINPELFDKVDPAKLPKPARGGGRSDPYRDLIKSADDRIVQLKVEIGLLGQVGAEAEALRYEQELLSRATDKGRSLDEKQIAAIRAKAEEYGKLRAELAATKLEQDLMFEREQLFRSPAEQRVHATLRGAGIDPASEQGQLLANQIRYNEQLKLGRDLALDFGNGLVQAFSDGKITLEELLQLVAQLFQQLASAPGGLSGLGGLIGSFFGGGGGFNPTTGGFAEMLGLAKGGAFTRGNVVPFAKGGAFTNSIVDRPTLFSFANGSKFGEMGEAGVEAVMPLKRDSQGRLGVISNGGGALGAHITIGISENNGNLVPFVESVVDRKAPGIARSEAAGAVNTYSYRQKQGGAASDDHRYKRLKRRG